MRSLIQRCSAIMLVAAGLCALPERAAATYAENFDSYVTGSMISGQGGWDGWDGSAGANSMVVDGGLSAPNRIRITGGSDSIRQLSGYTSGKWVFRAKQFVSSTSVGDSYLILLNRYQHFGPYSWSVQLRCNAAAGVIQENRSSATGPSLPLVTDQWKEIRCEIDISANTVDVYYDNQLLVSQPWKIPTDTNAQDVLACIDLYSDNPASLAFYDDIRIDPGGPQLAFGNMHTRIGGAILEVQNTPAGQRVRSTVTDGDNLLNGIAVADGTNDGTCIMFDPLDIATTPDGASMMVTLNGLPPGEPVIDICRVVFDKATPKILTKCLGGRSYQEYTIECYLENQLVATSPNGAGGAGPELLQWPYWMESRVKKECRPFHRHAIFVPPGGLDDQGDVWIGLGRMDEPGHGVQLVTLPDGTAALCNLIRFVPAPQPGLAKHKGAGYNVKQNVKCRTTTITGEMRYAFGHAVKSLGDNVVVESDMASAARRVRFDNLGSSGQDGAEFHTCPSNGMDAVWDPITSPPVDGAYLQMEAMGMLNGTHSRLGQTQCRFRPAFFDVFADFSDIGAGSMKVIGRRAGSVVFQSDNVPNGLIGSGDRWPRCGGKLGRPTPCFRWWWGSDFPFLHLGSVYLIDELLLLADGPPGTQLDNLDVLRFNTRDIPQLTFTDFQALEYKRVEITPTLEGCPDPAGEIAHYQVRDADTGQVVQEGDAPVGSDGRIIIEVWYKGRCIIHIEFGRYLQKNTGPRVLENLNFFDVFFMAGDADGDNEVTIGDFALLSSAFGSSPGMPNWNPMCDFECDDEITIGDYALLSQNFGEVGDD